MAAGALRVSNTSGARNISYTRDQVNIESSIPFVNLLRSIGEALGTFFNPAFGTSLRDQRAQADLRTIRTDSGVTRLVGADAIRFGNRAMLVPLGGGQVLAIGPGGLVSGGSRIEADGGVAVVSGSAVKIAAATASAILQDVIINPQRVLTVTSALGGANLALLGGNNLVSTGVGGIQTQGGGLFLDNANGLISNTGVKLIGNDGSTLVGNDGASLAGGLNGAGLVTDSGAGLKLAGGQGNALIGNDSAGLIGLDGSTLIGNDGST